MLARSSSRPAIGWFLLVSFASSVVGCGTGRGPQPENGDTAELAITYPDARVGDVVDELHGVKVADPYRWLEDEEGSETRSWIDAQCKLTESFLGSIGDREKIRERLTKLWNYEKRTTPFKEGDRYFYRHNTGLQNQSVLYVATAKDAPGRVLIDPNRLSKDGTVSLASTSVSKDGKLIAYSISSGGSDWREWRVREVDTGKDLADVIKWSKFSGASWTPDGKGFFYSRYAAPKEGDKLQGENYYQKLYYHRLGTKQEDDLLVLEDPRNKDLGFSGFVSDDGEYLCVHVWKGTARENCFYYAPLAKVLSDDAATRRAAMVKLVDAFKATYDYIANVGSVFYFRSSDEAPRNRVIAIDVAKPDRGNWREIVPQAREALQSVSFVNGQFLASYLRDARTVITRYLPDGAKIDDVALPGIGTASGFGGKATDTETFYSFSTFTAPPTIYRYDLLSGESEPYFRPEVAFDPEQFETKQVFYSSKDGTRVPMFITHKRGLELNSANPTLLYGYGGFNISLTPRFSVANLVWMEMGGIFVQANLRGGGEYGRAWHQAGTKLRKQNVFDDFIAAAEFLLAEGYTDRARLAIAGGSNGGLLVGACMTQRPELFAACLPAVGVLDMLRFHKFTIGHAWTSDYGSPENAEEFKYLLSYSPYHNLRKGTQYPATMITTADHDDRVVPAHSFKFAARLQAAHEGPNPVLIRIETRAGHGAGKPTSMRIAEAADRWAFLARVLGLEGGVSFE